MIDLGAPIASLEQAQAYFKAMGCNHFHLCRESGERYEEYRALGISKERERAWRIEEFDGYLSKIFVERDSDALWIAQSRLLDLLPSFDDDRAASIAYFEQLLKATRHAAAGMVGRDRVILAETIIGRTADRSDGMVARAYALKRSEFADELLSIASQLLSFEDKDAQLAKRRSMAEAAIRELAQRNEHG